MRKLRLIASIAELIVGITLVVCSFMNLVDEFWSGWGVAMSIVGALFLLRI